MGDCTCELLWGVEPEMVGLGGWNVGPVKVELV